MAFTTIISTSVLAQSAQDHDERLLAKFSEKELKAMTPDEVQYWNFVVDNGYVVFEIKKEKSESEMENIDFNGDVNALNPLSLGLLPDESSVKTYSLGSTGFGIMVLSEKKIRAKMERLNK